ncbi:plastin-2-like protein, partial [Euroglyphus maynei]
MDTLTANLETLSLSEEQTDSIENIFNKNRSLDANALKDALDIVGFKLPLWRVRILIEDIDKKKSFNLEKGRLTKEEFIQLCMDLRAQDVANSFKQTISKRGNLETLGGMSEASSSGTTHSVRHEEQVAFSDWINTHLSCDSDLKSLLPIDLEGKTLYDKVKDGILLCKIINHSCPDTIDERAINKKNLTLYTKHENLTLALNSAQAIGCNIINIDAHDLSKGRPHLVLGLLWQIIRIGLFNQITIEHCPGLVNLLNDNEEMGDLLKLSPEEILIRWVNYQLEKANVDRRISNFTNDIKDSEVYTHLLHQIAPPEKNVNKDALRERDMLERAEIMLKQADKLGCRSFLTPQNVVDGVYKLNVAFVANLFNNYPGLDTPENIEPLETIEETREEKTYRNWMNSMGVDPYVNWLYSDLADGKIIFQ